MLYKIVEKKPSGDDVENLVEMPQKSLADEIVIHRADFNHYKRQCFLVKLFTVVAVVGLFLIWMHVKTDTCNNIFKDHVYAPIQWEQHADEYAAYSEKYNKAPAKGPETMKRLKAFDKTSQKINEWNYAKEHGDNVEYGHNDLSDMTEEEFQKTLLPMSFYQRLHKEAEFIKPIPESLAAMKGERNGAIPDFFDWRDRNVVTPVKAQGSCGSCWAFASTATVEAQYAINHGERRNLSEQTLLDCDLVDNACDGGDEDKAFRYIHRNGLAYAVDLPYVAHRQNTCAVQSQWNTTKIKAAYFLHHDEDSMINWLLNFGPVNIGMAVIQPMRSYKGGVFTPSAEACKNEVIGLHALMITGYGTSKEGEKYWIVKNSWGNTWGVEHGYIYFARGINACGIEDEPIGILA